MVLELLWFFMVCYLSSSSTWGATRCFLVCQPLPSCCWSYSGCFSVFGHVGILGFLVADYALLWFKIVYVGIYVSKEFVPYFCIDLIYLQVMFCYRLG